MENVKISVLLRIPARFVSLTGSFVSVSTGVGRFERSENRSAHVGRN